MDDGHRDEPITSNVMRHQYKPLSESDQARVHQVKDVGRAFFHLCDELGKSRELSLAKTKIEEAVFWAVKHLTA